MLLAEDRAIVAPALLRVVAAERDESVLAAALLAIRFCILGHMPRRNRLQWRCVGVQVNVHTLVCRIVHT